MWTLHDYGFVFDEEPWQGPSLQDPLEGIDILWTLVRACRHQARRAPLQSACSWPYTISADGFADPVTDINS
jgi:hypothetical protein